MKGSVLGQVLYYIGIVVLVGGVGLAATLAVTRSVGELSVFQA